MKRKPQRKRTPKSRRKADPYAKMFEHNRKTMDAVQMQAYNRGVLTGMFMNCVVWLALLIIFVMI